MKKLCRFLWREGILPAAALLLLYSFIVLPIIPIVSGIVILGIMLEKFAHVELHLW